MAKIIQVPGAGEIEFPDNMPDSEIEKVLQREASAIQPDDRNFVAKYFNPRKEDFPEYSGARTPEGALQAENNSPLQRRDSSGTFQASLSEDKYGNPTIVTERGTFYINKPGPSFNDAIGLARGVKDTAEDVAPFIATGGATAAAGPLVGIAAQGLTGLAKESLNQVENAQTGKQVDYGKLVSTPLFAMGGEAVGRMAFAVMKPIFTKLFGGGAPSRVVNADGSLTDDAIRALDKARVDPGQLDDMALQELSKMQQAGVLTKEQAQRFNLFTKQGLAPTKAQITRSASDFQLQQEAAKTSTSVKSALEAQEGQISKAFDTTIRGTGGNAVSSGSPVADAVLNKASILDSRISRLYKVADQRANGGKVIPMNRLAARLKSFAPQNEISGGLVRAVRGDLMQRGIIDKNFKVIGKVDAKTAEEVRKSINSLFDAANKNNPRITAALKESLDDDVMAFAGEDVFKAARQAKAQFEAGLRVSKLSKFDANERSLVKDILQNKIKSEDVFERSVLSKSWKASDLRELRQYLTAGSKEQAQTGIQAWNDLRAETVQWIKDQAFSNALDQTGQASMRSGAIKKSLDKIGADRLSVLFNAEERKFMSTMANIESLRQPVPLTGVGKGPSAQAIQQLQGSIGKLGAIFKPLMEILDARQVLSTPVPAAVARATEQAAKTTVVSPAASAGVVVGNRLIEER